MSETPVKEPLPQPDMSTTKEAPRRRPGAPRRREPVAPAGFPESKRDSIWTATAKMPTRRRLERDLETEVCVIGAGMAGLSVAYTLAKAGKSVAVLERASLAGGMTSVTTAHITVAADDRYFQLEKYHGEAATRLVAESYVASIDRIEQVVEAENIDCDFRRVDGYLFVPPGDTVDILDRELAAAHRVGLTDVERLERAPIASFETGPCLRFPRQAQFHPLKYLAALTRCIERAGGHVFSRTHVDEIVGGHPARVLAGKRTVTAETVVVATNAPINDMVVVHTKQAPYMTYVIAGMIPKGSVTEALYWDTAEPYHYVRLQSFDEHNDLIIVGGEDHRTGEAQETGIRHGKLETWARARFPMLRDVRYRWAGQVMEPFDSLAFIGRNPSDDDNIYIASGDSGQGITHGAISGMLIPDLVLGRENRWTEVYDPSRKTIAAAMPYVADALNVVSRYVEHVTPGEVETVEEIPKNTGAVMRRGLQKLAVYRDEEGTVHELSANCTHLGCIVAWNAAEKSWDCPCHGSRYDKLGKVFNGPAVTDLRPAEPVKRHGWRRG